MNWITTNIRLPEDVYMDLKITAAKQRKSVAAVIREQLGVKAVNPDRKEFWEKVDGFAKNLAAKYPKANLGEKLIEIRYEQ